METASQSCLVVEHLNSREIKFFQIMKPVASENQKKKDTIQLVQLGLQVGQSKMLPSALLKYRSVSKINSETKKRY